MKDKLMLGFWRYMLKAPPFLWESQISKAKKKFEAENSFMSEEHGLVHHFVVRELPYAGKPLLPEFVASRLNLSVSRVKVIFDDLEERMTFLVRNGKGEVVWAYPVTVDKTPHHLTFTTGEQLYAA